MKAGAAMLHFVGVAESLEAKVNLRGSFADAQSSHRVRLKSGAKTVLRFVRGRCSVRVCSQGLRRGEGLRLENRLGGGIFYRPTEQVAGSQAAPPRPSLGQRGGLCGPTIA